jgi:hypothetical protein
VPRKITVKQVREIACPEALIAFLETFGDEVEVTEENLKRLPEMLWEPTMAAALLSSRSVCKMLTGAPHSGFVPGPNCPGCMAEMLAFIKLYNEEQEDEGLLGSGEREESPEPSRV